MPSRGILAFLGNANHLQEFSNGHVELVFVICDDLCAVCGLNCGALERHTPKIAKRSGKLIPQWIRTPTSRARRPMLPIRLLLNLRGFLARSWWLSWCLYRLHRLPLVGPPGEGV